MPLADYTHVVSFGNACMAPHQLRRATQRSSLPRSRFLGPFDWFIIDVPQCIAAIESDFENFFTPQGARCHESLHHECWHVTDSKGVVSMHHLPRSTGPGSAGDGGPDAAAWYAFGKWLGVRLCRWREMLAARGARILAVRQSDPAKPDTPAELEGLAAALSARAHGQVTVLGVFFSTPPRIDDTRVKTGVVEPSWPPDADLSTVRWDQDYGRGPVWQGDSSSWDAMWDSL